MSPLRLRTVALLAREPGIAVLRDALIGHPALDLCAVFTHGQLPKAEGGGQRSETAEIAALCGARGIPLKVTDGEAARNLAMHLPEGPLDLLVSLSWRYVLPSAALTKFGWGCLNLHRGDLPRYAGAKPVQRAIEAGDRRVAISAHEMVEEVDAGKIYGQVWLDIPACPTGVDPADHAETVKRRLVPLYAPLTTLAIAAKIAGGKVAQ